MSGSVVHRFPGNTSAEVYAFTQTSNTVKDGDVLVVPDEGVVGVLVAAWPVAVSRQAGAFHETAPGFDWDAVEWDGETTKSYRASYDAAVGEDFVSRVSAYVDTSESVVVTRIRQYAEAA